MSWLLNRLNFLEDFDILLGFCAVLHSHYSNPYLLVFFPLYTYFQKLLNKTDKISLLMELIA